VAGRPADRACPDVRLGASTIGDIYRGVFKAILNKAILDGRLAVSPCHRIELP